MIQLYGFLWVFYVVALLLLPFCCFVALLSLVVGLFVSLVFVFMLCFGGSVFWYLGFVCVVLFAF